MSRMFERYDDVRMLIVMLLAIVAVVATLFFAFPDEAQAQEEAQETQAELQRRVVTVEPGDSLWSIAQERLDQNVAPGEIGNEVGRIFELNRGQIGGDPNVIVMGQDLLMPPRTSEPADPEASGPAYSEQINKPSALPDLPELPAGEAVSAVRTVRINPESRHEGRRMLGFGLLVLSVAGGLLAVGILAAQNLPKLRRESHRRYLYRASYAFPKDPGSYENPSSLVPESLALAHGPHRPEHADQQEEKEPPPPVSIPREDVPETLDEEENREPRLGPRDEPGTRTPRAASLRYAWLAGDFELHSERSEDAPLEDKKYALGERR
jgi:hypothetical protein